MLVQPGRSTPMASRPSAWRRSPSAVPAVAWWDSVAGNLFPIVVASAQARSRRACDWFIVVCKLAVRRYCLASTCQATREMTCLGHGVEHGLDVAYSAGPGGRCGPCDRRLISVPVGDRWTDVRRSAALETAAARPLVLVPGSRCGTRSGSAVPAGPVGATGRVAPAGRGCVRCGRFREHRRSWHA